MDQIKIGKFIAECRKKKNLTQAQLAEMLNVTDRAISKWETGKNYPSIEVIITLSDLFGITIDELLRSDEELKEKIIQDSKQLAYPNWKLLFDSMFLFGVFLYLSQSHSSLCSFAKNQKSPQIKFHKSPQSNL